MRIPFISKPKPSSAVSEPSANKVVRDFEVLMEEECKAVAGGPQIQNNPERSVSIEQLTKVEYLAVAGGPQIHNDPQS